MRAPGITTEPVILPVASPGQTKPDSVMGKVPVPGVIVVVAWFHVAPKETLDTVTTQLPRGLVIVMTALTFVTSIAVVLVAVKVQEELDVAEAPVAPKMPATVQACNTGPAGVELPWSVVKASAPPAERVPAL